MTETQFIDNNKKYWEELESLLDRSSKDADKLSELFVKVSSDLSYARTYYPNRSVRLYLNNLTQRVFDSMRTDGEKFKLSQITDFFRHILPQEIYNSRKALLTSFFVFAVALIIGVISSKYHPNFVESILGADYVQMTEDNIAKGDPMAVYKDERKLDMLFGITFNNIKVAFLAFVLGIIGSIGTIFVLISNGIMVGAFQYFFVTKGLFWESFLTIWIHGTIEISAIIIAGGAGIVLGNGLLFPKTYNRSSSMQMAALRALRIILGTVPLFVIAGLLESFVTRQTGLPTIVRGGIIFFSAVLIILMWIVYPWYYHKNKLGEEVSHDLTPIKPEERTVNFNRPKLLSEILSDSLYLFRKNISSIIKHALVPSLFVLISAVGLFLATADFDTQFASGPSSLAKLDTGNFIMSLLYLVLISFAFCMIALVGKGSGLTLDNKLKFIKSNYIPILFFTACLYLPFALLDNPYWLFAFIIFPPHFYVIAIQLTVDTSNSFFTNFKEALSFAINNWFKFVYYYLIALFFAWIILLIKGSLVIFVVEDFFRWHNLFDNDIANVVFIRSIVDWSILVICTVPLYYALKHEYHSLRTTVSAKDLKERIKLFGNTNTIFEAQ